MEQLFQEWYISDSSELIMENKSSNRKRKDNLFM